MSFDPVAAIEACYADAPSEGAWLGKLVETFAPLSTGLPAFAYAFRMKGPDFDVRAHSPWAGGTLEPLLAIWREAPPEVQRIWHAASPPVGLASRALARSPPEFVDRLGAYFRGAGFREAIAVSAVGPDGTGVVVTVPIAEPRPLSAWRRHQLGRVAAHLGTTLRLRARLAAAGSPVDAVLDGRGRLQHAEAAAQPAGCRAALERAVRAVSRARGPLRARRPAEALEIWRGLVAGRWSLVDHVDSDGKRLVLARRNEPEVRDPLALAPRERAVVAYAALGHSNKYIGYLLGLSASSVATHLRAGMTKLRLRSRRELILLLGAGRRPGDRSTG